MITLEKKLRANLRRLGIGTEARLVVAVSGGADSTALLDALVRFHKRDSLIVAHLNHLLRGEESDEDEKFVMDLAARLRLDCIVERVDVAGEARGRKENLEATARRLRYDFLRRVAENRKCEAVLTAHTQDDQVETIVMRLLRGTGPDGLRGIHQVRRITEMVRLIRPMLEITRNEVIEHCQHHDIAFRTDSSNLLTSLTRNRVRHELLPLLRSFNHRFNETLARTAELLTDDQDYLKQITSEVYAVVHRGSELDIGPLREVHPAIRRYILRMWLGDVRGGLQRIELSHLKALEDLIIRNQSGQSVDLPADWIARREFNHITLTRREEIFSRPLEPLRLVEENVANFGRFRFSIQRNLPCQGSGHEDQKEKIGHYIALLRECEELDGLILRTRTSGDAYLPQGRGHKIKLKTLMIKRKIPLSERDDYPVLVTAQGQIVWAPGLPVARQFAVDVNDERTSSCALVTAEKLDQSTNHRGRETQRKKRNG
jgi:tRNA(Ile)-lysidine synthase